jgi:hypothetical protein
MMAAAATLALHLLGGAPFMAQAMDPDAYGDDYQLGNFGRVQYQENGVTIMRAAVNHDQQPVEQARVNAPVFPGDTVVTGYDQRAELQLARGSLVRVDRATEITFLALTDPYAEFQDNTILQLQEGTIQLSALLEEKEEFRIDTPAASVYLLGDGDFRIEVNSQGRTQVVSRRGVAEVVGNGGSVLVRGGMLSDVYPGGVPRNPEPFNTFASDAFDHWVAERDDAYRVRDRYADSSGYSGEVYEDLPYEVRPYYRELNSHGSWVYVDDYDSYVWRPRGVTVSWRPYYDGYWSYGPHGYFWVSYEPWGWAPYHYGRWSYVGHHGWCWIPGRVFGGAWVAWSWGSAHVGWAPLGYWNRPVWYNSLYYDYYDPYCWTFVGYNHFYHHNYRRYAVPWNQVHSQVQRYAVVTRPPRVSPRQLANSDEYRRRAYREARDNDRGRIRPVLRESRPESTVRDLERGLHRRVAETRKKAGRTPADRRAGPDRASAAGGNLRTDRSVDRGKLSVAREPGRRGEIKERTMPAYPRRISGEDGDRRRGQATGRTRGGADSGSRDSRRAADLPQVKPRQNESGGTNERIRDLYRKMSGPRTTREQPSAGSRPGRSDRSGASTTPKRTTPRRETTTPQRTAPRRDTSARKPQSGQRSTGSQQKARPKKSTSRSGSGGSEPRANSRNSTYRSPSAPARSSTRSGSSSSRRSETRATGGSYRSQRSNPRASGSSSRSGRSTPKASSSSSRSGRSTPRASGSSSRSSGSSSRARGGSSRGGRSTPKASGSSSRSSGSSRARGGSSRSSGSSGKSRGSSSRSSSGGRRGGKK